MNTELFKIAEYYHALGIPVIPFEIWKNEKGIYEKKNIGYWKQWETQPQTEEEFKNLNWNEANGLGVLLGIKAKNGLYLSVVDHDVKGKTIKPGAIEKGKEILKNFPITRMVETANKGLHYEYWSKIRPNIEGKFHDDAALELLGEKKLCLMAGLGYEPLNDNPPREIEDLETTFYTILKKYGFTKTEEETQNQLDNYSFQLSKIIDLTNFTKNGFEYQGAHPLHGSSTEKNFCVNVKNNTWYCFRHNSGGGALQYLAMKEGIIDCEKIKKGALKGKKFRAALRIAVSQGLIDEKILEQQSQADRLIDICLSEDIELFFDQHNTPYAKITMPIDELRNCAICDTSVSLARSVTTKNIEKTQEGSPKVTETPQTPQYRNIIIQIGNSQFKSWLSYLMWNEEKKAPGNDSLNSAINVLKGKAQQEGKQYTLYNRVAPAQDGIWLDMADEKWRAIKITSEGWNIVDNPPILFKRYVHQQPLIEPIREGADAWKIFDFMNIDPTDNDTKLSLLCCIIGYLIPLIPHPAIIVSGSQGSAKSWLLKLVKRLIDPSSIELLTLPRDERELAQQLEHHWIAPYDNLTTLPVWASDMFCRAVTGGGIAVRKLYSDDEDTILQFKRCVLLNGINVAAQRGDLLDRSELIVLDPIPKEKRKTEEELNANFEKEKPLIFAGFLNALSIALKNYADIKLEGYQRLADFNRYGCAIAQGLGKTQEEFTKAYSKKIDLQNQEALNADSIALIIHKLCKTEVRKYKEKDAAGIEKNEGLRTFQPTELYSTVKNYATDMGIDVKAKSFPKSPNALTRRINDVKPALKAVGIVIESIPGTIRKIQFNASKMEASD